jgi:hypothetical protein
MDLDRIKTILGAKHRPPATTGMRFQMKEQGILSASPSGFGEAQQAIAVRIIGDIIGIGGDGGIGGDDIIWGYDIICGYNIICGHDEGAGVPCLGR